jgi:hypothetical protein
MPIVHITETRGAAIVWARAHVCVVSLAVAQNAVAVKVQQDLVLDVSKSGSAKP